MDLNRKFKKFSTFSFKNLTLKVGSFSLFHVHVLKSESLTPAAPPGGRTKKRRYNGSQRFPLLGLI